MDDGLKSMWGMSDTEVTRAKALAYTYKQKHGMFAGVPLICASPVCKYEKVCIIDSKSRPCGKRCPMEIGAIISRFDMWCNHFNIKSDGDYIDDKDLVDATLIRDLVDNEIQTLRAENRVAINADFIARTISQIDNKGKVYYEDVVSPEAQFKLTLQERRYKILNLLNSTRKDKAKEMRELNPSQQAMNIFKKITEALPDDLSMIDFDNIDSEVKHSGDGGHPEGDK